jgi:hypothetical protein
MARGRCVHVAWHVDCFIPASGAGTSPNGRMDDKPGGTASILVPSGAGFFDVPQLSPLARPAADDVRHLSNYWNKKGGFSNVRDQAIGEVDVDS